VAISAGGDHSLALKADGSIAGWGRNNNGQAVPPSGNGFVAISAGGGHSLALKADGNIVGWGHNYSGQSTPPSGNDFVAVSAGWNHSLALKADGSIAGWGYNFYGQAAPPSGNDFVAVSAGGYHSLALKADGSIAGWGRNDWGQATPPSGNDFVAIAAGAYHNLALKADGSIAGWGYNTYGQATPPSGSDFVGISAGVTHCLAIKEVPPIEAEIKLTPDTLNLQSKGKWLTCYIWLAEDYNVADVNSDSVLLEDEIPADWIWFDEEQQVIMAKFSRTAVKELLTDLETPAEVELLVSGELSDGTIFEGTDTIRVIDKGKRRNNSGTKEAKRSKKVSRRGAGDGVWPPAKTVKR
jgi:hypothetical protein